MKYAHIKNTELFGWYDSKIHEVIPEPNIEVTDKVWQEAININANAYEDGEFVVKDFRTEAEKLQADKENKIEEAKKYLADTDWIIVKISEATAMGANVEELKTKYAEQLIGRSEARYKINELEG